MVSTRIEVSMKIGMWHIVRVKPCEADPRKNDGAIDAVAGSIREFGVRVPLIACEQTNRHAFLMEIDPAYCDVIVQRWEEFTGKKAKRTSTAGVSA